MNTQVLTAMYKHLVASLEKEEARDLLIAKYPELEGEIEMICDETIYPEVEYVADTEAALADLESEIEEVSVAPKVDVIKKQKVDKKQKVAKVAKVKKPSAKGRCREIFAEAMENGKTRKEIIEQFVQELGISVPHATAYYYTINKENTTD